MPFILSLQDAEFDNTIDHFRRLRGAPAVANSQFTSNAYKRFNIDARVIHPPIERHLYLTERTGTKVLLVNPVEEKGVSLAIEVAKLVPEIQFKFLLTWPLSEDELLDLKAKLDSISNIELAKSCRDMRSAYGEARLLFAPSQWQEGYGRVVTEAQTSGIPVLASNRGGLPESVGNGGIVIRHDAPPNEWAVALQEMLKPRNYEALSKRAKEHAERPELDLDRQISSWETMIENTIRAAAAIRQPAPPAAS